MTDENDKDGPPAQPPEPPAESGLPRPPDNEEYERRVKEAMARGEDPMPIIREATMQLLDYIRAKYADKK